MKQIRVMGMVAWGVGAMLVACGGTDGATASEPGLDAGGAARDGEGNLGGDGAGAAGGEAGANGGDGGGGGDANADGGTDEAGLVRRIAAITLTSSTDFSSAYATFEELSPSDPCARTLAGACEAVSCPLGDGGATPATLYNAGDIALSGGGFAAGAKIAAQPGGGYQGLSTRAPFWSGGETIRLAAPGSSSVGAFSASFVAPTKASVSAPRLGTGTTTTIPRDAPLNVAWSGGNDTIFIALSGADATTSTTVQCLFPAANGAGQVPASMLSHLPATPTGYVVISSRSLEKIQPAMWSDTDVISSTLAAAGTVTFR